MGWVTAAKVICVKNWYATKKERKKLQKDIMKESCLRKEWMKFFICSSLFVVMGIKSKHVDRDVSSCHFSAAIHANRCNTPRSAHVFMLKSLYNTVPVLSKFTCKNINIKLHGLQFQYTLVCGIIEILFEFSYIFRHEDNYIMETRKTWRF